MTNRFQVDLRGIIDLAANHLYTSPDVFVRELIQNSVDAITARTRLDPAFRGTIRVELTPAAPGATTPPSICVTDDGIGLTLSEVHQFLSTVGSSSKREDAESLAESEDRGSFLGRFGIGLLSCFMVTDEIVVLTRSARDPAAPAVEWRGRADGSYAVRELPDSRIPAGTSVYLTPKTEEVAEYFERERLFDLVRQYAEMLPTRLIVACGPDEQAINKHPAWLIDESDDQALSDYCQEALGFQPLDAFRITAPAGDTVGYAFIRPDRTTPRNDHRLYAHGMFVCDHLFGLVPEWSTFISCVLNTTGLRLTASRESLHNNEALEQSQEQVAAAIRGRFARLLRTHPQRFQAIMAVHDTEIRGLAVKDPDFFALIIDLLEFDTTLGPVRFGEFRRENHDVLVARTSEQFRRLVPIAMATSLRVFNGGFTFHEELLARAVERFPELHLRAFDTADLAETLTPPDDASPYEHLLAAGETALAGRQCEVAIRDFEPASMPAFFALGLDAEFHRDVDRTKSMASGLWNEILDAMAPRPEHLAPTRLCLNARCPVVRRLAAIPDPSLQSLSIQMLYVQALMAGQHPLTEDEMNLLNSAMDGLLRGIANAGPNQ